jgi:hypothetical protein
MLKLGAIVGAPAILSLAPSIARADGSWKSMPGSKARAQGSWCGHTMGRVVERHAGDFDQEMSGSGSGGGGGEGDQSGEGFVIPGSYRWRVLRAQEKEERDRLRGDFSQFGQD